MQQPCTRKPPNGEGLCIRDDDFEELATDGRATLTLVERLERRTTEEFLGVFAAISRVETKVDRLLEGVAIGNVSKAELPPIDYDPDENTMHGRESPEIAASIWKARNAESIEREAVLRSELAAAQATIAERDRQSVRALAMADRSWSKWQKIGAGVLALIAALGGGAGLLKLLGG